MDNAAAAERPVWRFLIQPRWLGWHVLMVVCFWGMLWLGDWQFHRALGGNALSWAYTFEWPLFAGFAVVFWAKTIRDEFRIRRGDIPDPRAAAAADPAERVQPVAGPGDPLRPYLATPVQAAPAGEDDPELSAYNAYLARLNARAADRGGR